MEAKPANESQPLINAVRDFNAENTKLDRGQEQRPLTFMTITRPETKDFTVTDSTSTSADVAVRNSHEEWSGEIWVAGASEGALGPGDVYTLRGPFKIGVAAMVRTGGSAA